MIDALKRALTEDKWTPSRDPSRECAHDRAPHRGSSQVMHQDSYHDDLAMASGCPRRHFESQ